MWPGLAGALLAALCYGAASVLQAVGVRRFAESPAGSPLRVRLRRANAYAVGLALDGVGFLASLSALRTLPLFLVQSAIAASIAVTAVLAVVFLDTHLRRSEVLALAAVGAGLVALAVSGSSGPSVILSDTASLILLLAIVPTGLLALTAVRRPFGRRNAAGNGRRAGRRRAVVLAIAAGVGFGGVGIAARVVVIPDPWWRLLGDPVPWALIGFAVLSSVCYAFALAAGRVTTVAAISLAIETVVPAAVGLRWLGDAVRPGFTALAVLGFLATLGGCLALSRSGELVTLESSGAG